MAQQLRIAVLGSTGSGKTTFSEQLYKQIGVQSSGEGFSEEAESFSLQLDIEDTQVTVEILDTEGSEQFSAIRNLCLKQCQGFVLLFSLDSEKSLRDLWPITKQIFSVKQTQDVPMVLVGNKCDLGDTNLKIESNVAQQAESKFGASYFECSAKYNLNVKRPLRHLVKTILFPDPKPTEEAPTKCDVQ